MIFMATQEDLINRRMRNNSPHPWNGICSTVTQHHETVTASYELWAKMLSEAKKSTDSLHMVDDILELQQIPELYAHHSKAFFPHDELYPRLQYVLDEATTIDSTCERPIRRTYHGLYMGVLRPLTYDFLTASKDKGHAKNLSRLILAWLYTLRQVSRNS